MVKIYKKELTLIALTLVCGGFIAALELKGGLNLFWRVEILPLVTALAEYVGVVMVLGKGNRVFSSYAFTCIFCAQILAAVFVFCFVQEQVEDLRNAILIALIFVETGLILGLVKLDKINNK